MDYDVDMPDRINRLNSDPTDPGGYGSSDDDDDVNSYTEKQFNEATKARNINKTKQ
ncbi:MAG: hypothetical protein K5770_07085 [Lachnospiraceae bacterium]|nr:hypothetical protein [Lachnospiraceae bacterium]